MHKLESARAEMNAAMKDLKDYQGRIPPIPLMFFAPRRFCRYHGTEKKIKWIRAIHDHKTGKAKTYYVYYKCPHWFCVMNCEANGTEYFSAPELPK